MSNRKSRSAKRAMSGADAKDIRIKSYVWREAADTDGKYIERPLVEYSEEELQRFYDLCREMIYSTNPSDPGRIKVLSEVERQRRNCNTALFLRHIRKSYMKTEYSLYDMLRSFVARNKDYYPDIEKQPVGNYIMGNCPLDFKDVTIQELMNACIDSLGIFSSRHITKRLIFSFGIYLSEEDMEELTPTKEELDMLMERATPESFNGKSGVRMRKLELIRERLGLKLYEDADGKTSYKHRMFLSYDGLTYSQFKAMIQLPSRAKYSELSLEQLKTLRDKVLPSLIMEVEKHINQWKSRMKKIKEVAEYRGFRMIT